MVRYYSSKILQNLSLATLFIGLSYTFAIGQVKENISLSGTVKDSLSGSPLKFAHIKIKGRPMGVPTNSEGRFTIHLDKIAVKDSMIISLIGYTSKTIPISTLIDKNPHTILLAESAVYLDEVTIEEKSAEDIIKEVAKRLKDNFPDLPFTFDGYYRNSYKELDKYVRQFETAFSGFDKNFHNRSGYAVRMLKRRESRDFRQFKWRQAQGNIPWHYLWHIRRQHHYFFTNKKYLGYDCSLEDIDLFEGEKVYKLKFSLKDRSERVSGSWVFVRADDYAILEIGGETEVLVPKKFQLSDSLSMAYTGGNIIVKYAEHDGKMYPSYASSLYRHKVYGPLSEERGNFDMNEELIIHEISVPTDHSSKSDFIKEQELVIPALPADSIFWATYNKPVETALSKAIEKDLEQQQESDNLSQTIGKPTNGTYSDKAISVDGLKEDFDLFRKSLQEAHPSLYRYTEKEGLDSLFQATYHSLDRSLSTIGFYRLLTPILAKIKCGHTGSLPPKGYMDNFVDQKIFLPFKIDYFDGKVYVKETYTMSNNLEAGDEIIKINGFAIEGIIDQIFTHLPVDGNITTSKYRLLTDDFAKLYSLYIEQTDNFEIVIRNDKGSVESVQVSAIHYGRFHYRNDDEAQNRYHLLDSNTALLKLGSFTDKDTLPFKDWIDETFDDISNQDIKNLIIDLRDNGGGRDDHAIYLLSFLVRTPFRYHLSLKVATNHFSFLEHTDQDGSLNRLMKEITRQDNSGNFLLQSSHPTLGTVQPRTDPFKGKIYFLINGNTFSAAADFAALSKEMKLGTFIGEETGGAFEGNTSNGEIILTLPNSKIRIGIPLFQIQNAVSKDHPTGRGVFPDHKTNPTRKDIKKNMDIELKKAMELISKN